MFNNSQALETKLENHVNQIQMLAATTSKMLGLIVSEKRLKKKKTNSTHRHSLLHENIRIHDGGQLMQKVWSLLKQLRCCLPHHILKLGSCSARNTIPGFWLTPKSTLFNTLKLGFLQCSCYSWC